MARVIAADQEPRPASWMYGSSLPMLMAMPPRVPSMRAWPQLVGSVKVDVSLIFRLGPPVDSLRVGAPPGRLVCETSRSVADRAEKSPHSAA